MEPFLFQHLSQECLVLFDRCSKHYYCLSKKKKSELLGVWGAGEIGWEGGETGPGRQWGGVDLVAMVHQILPLLFLKLPAQSFSGV